MTDSQFCSEWDSNTEVWVSDAGSQKSTKIRVQAKSKIENFTPLIGLRALEKTAAIIKIFWEKMCELYFLV